MIKLQHPGIIDPITERPSALPAVTKPLPNRTFIKNTAIRHFICLILQTYISLLPFPKRGLKFLVAFLERYSLLDHPFVKSLPCGIRMTLCFRDHIQRQLLWYGYYEKKELQLAGNFIPLNGVVIDAGANIGYHSLCFSRHCPGGSVHALEPSPLLYEKLCNQLRLNHSENIHPHAMALDDRNGVQVFHTAGADNTGMGGFMNTGNASVREGTVSGIRLDDFISRNGLTALDLVKIDVEGAEIRVLKGMPHTLQTLRPIVLVECSSATLAFYGEKLSTLYGLLKGQGYLPFEAVDGKTLRRISREKELSLAFFIPKERTGQLTQISIEG